MYNSIEIGGKTLELVANAATPYRVKQVFHIDVLKTLFASQDDNGLGASNIVPELTYIMNMQALKKDMSKLNLESFYAWCEDFGALELLNHAEEILSLYIDNLEVDSKAKKKKEQ